jgi:phosphate uptake regulator
MLSGVLTSPKAVRVNIEIMRAFVELRRMIDSNKELLTRIEKLEEKYDAKFQIVFEAIKELMKEDEKPRSKIGF